MLRTIKRVPSKNRHKNMTVMTIGRNTETHNINVENEVYKKQCIKYLASILEQKGSLDREINNISTNINTIYEALYSTCFNKKDTSKKAETKIY